MVMPGIQNLENHFRDMLDIEFTIQEGKLVSSAKDEKAESVYEMYYEYDEALSKVAGHRTLAINRGENEKILTVKVEAPTEDMDAFMAMPYDEEGTVNDALIAKIAKIVFFSVKIFFKCVFVIFTTFLTTDIV